MSFARLLLISGASILFASCASGRGTVIAPTRSADICLEILRLREFQESVRRSGMDSTRLAEAIELCDTRILRLAKIDSLDDPDAACSGFKGKKLVFPDGRPDHSDVGARIVAEIFVEIVLPALLKR